MEVQTRKLNWIEIALFALSLVFLGLGICNIHYDVLGTSICLLISSLALALLLARNEKILENITKTELIKIALFKNIILWVILFVGFGYNMFRINMEHLAIKFFAAALIYFVVMMFFDTDDIVYDGIDFFLKTIVFLFLVAFLAFALFFLVRVVLFSSF